MWWKGWRWNHRLTDARLESGKQDMDIKARIGEVLAAIDGILTDAKGRWLLSGEGEAELQLSGLHLGKVDSVILDRVKVDADGTHWIVDYKTGSHEGGDLALFLQAETERYRSQLARYASIYSAYSGAVTRSA